MEEFRIPRIKPFQANVGVFGVGYWKYWDQFEGLLDEMHRKQKVFVEKLGESMHGPVPPTGNTNTRGFFRPNVKTFLKRWVAEGPTHHFALGIGHHACTIKKIAKYLNIEAVIISDDYVHESKNLHLLACNHCLPRGILEQGSFPRQKEKHLKKLKSTG